MKIKLRKVGNHKISLIHKGIVSQVPSFLFSLSDKQKNRLSEEYKTFVLQPKHIKDVALLYRLGMGKL